MDAFTSTMAYRDHARGQHHRPWRDASSNLSNGTLARRASPGKGRRKTDPCPGGATDPSPGRQPRERRTQHDPEPRRGDGARIRRPYGAHISWVAPFPGPCGPGYAPSRLRRSVSIGTGWYSPSQDAVRYRDRARAGITRLGRIRHRIHETEHQLHHDRSVCQAGPAAQTPWPNRLDLAPCPMVIL